METFFFQITGIGILTYKRTELAIGQINLNVSGNIIFYYRKANFDLISLKTEYQFYSFRDRGGNQLTRSLTSLRRQFNLCHESVILHS